QPGNDAADVPLLGSDPLAKRQSECARARPSEVRRRLVPPAEHSALGEQTRARREHAMVGPGARPDAGPCDPMSVGIFVTPGGQLRVERAPESVPQVSDALAA